VALLGWDVVYVEEFVDLAHLGLDVVGGLEVVAGR